MELFDTTIPYGVILTSTIFRNFSNFIQNQIKVDGFMVQQEYHVGTNELQGEQLVYNKNRMMQAYMVIKNMLPISAGGKRPR